MVINNIYQVTKVKSFFNKNSISNKDEAYHNMKINIIIAVCMCRVCRYKISQYSFESTHEKISKTNEKAQNKGTKVKPVQEIDKVTVPSNRV